MTVKKLNNLAALKNRAQRMKLMLRQDRQTKVYSLNTIGRSGIHFQSLDLAAVERWLKRKEKEHNEALTKFIADALAEEAPSQDGPEIIRVKTTVANQQASK